MEFPGLGRHCQNKECNQTDFLPLQCKCGMIFCREHFNEHCLSGLCEEAPHPKEPKLINDDVLYKCSQKGCNVSTLHENLCLKCQKHFCIAHRFHPECPEVDPSLIEAEKKRKEDLKAYIAETDINLQAAITEKIRKALQTPKAKTAMKIQVMRIKQKAVGPKAMPTAHKVYFSITKPKDSNMKKIEIVNTSHGIDNMQTMNYEVDLKDSLPLFLNKTWTVGRNLDLICHTFCVTNDNNKQGSKKTMLFRHMDGLCLRKFDVTLESLLEKQILVEGDRLLIEYIDSNDLNIDENSLVLLKLPVENKS